MANIWTKLVPKLLHLLKGKCDACKAHAYVWELDDIREDYWVCGKCKLKL